MQKFIDLIDEPWAADKTVFYMVRSSNVGTLKKISFNDLFVIPKNLELHKNEYRCIAGGSLSNHLYCYLNKYKHIPVKDIDIFFHANPGDNYYRIEPFIYTTTEYNLMTAEERRNHLMESIQSGMSITNRPVYLDNRNNFNEAKDSKKSELDTYRIFNVDYYDKLNYIGIHGRTKFFSTKDFANYVLQGFDLNQTQIAIYDINKNNSSYIGFGGTNQWDIERFNSNKKEYSKFHYTKDFVKYLETGILEIVNPYSFASSCLRLLNKTEQIPGISCDIEKEIFIITQFYLNFHENVFIRKKIIKANEKFSKYKTLLEEFFIFEEDENFITFIPKIKKIDLTDSEFNFKAARKFFEKKYFQSRTEKRDTGREMVSVLKLQTPEMFNQQISRISPHSR